MSHSVLPTNGTSPLPARESDEVQLIPGGAEGECQEAVQSDWDGGSREAQPGAKTIQGARGRFLLAGGALLGVVGALSLSGLGGFGRRSTIPATGTALEDDVEQHFIIADKRNNTKDSLQAGVANQTANSSKSCSNCSSKRSDVNERRQLVVHEELPRCTAGEADCSKTKCCADPGMQCFEKNEFYARCMPSCEPGLHLTDVDASPWTCNKIGERAPGTARECATGGEDCSKSKCCKEIGMQCYEKVPSETDENESAWAVCKASCNPGPDLSDIDGTAWTCKELGSRSKISGWVKSYCANDWGTCQHKKCCASEGKQCFTMNEYYARCMDTCSGMDCKPLGPRTPTPPSQSAAPSGTVNKWVYDTCADKHHNCMDSQCCTDPGHQCFTINNTWASCLLTCKAGPDLFGATSEPLRCDPLGPRTPGNPSPFRLTPEKEAQKVSKWVHEECARPGEECMDKKCCSSTGMQCYGTVENKAQCKYKCDWGPNSSCWEVGARTPPSIFCASVIYSQQEQDLVRLMMRRSAGIFVCDGFALFSSHNPAIDFGVLPKWGSVKTIPFKNAPVVASKDGTAGNSELFLHFWDAVKADGRYKSADWTIKVDADAVLLPGRLRWHLGPHTGQKVYIVNCNKPMMPEGPMMFGALEAISNWAIKTYYAKAADCITGFPEWKTWGEDWFMGHCLEKLGVQRVEDFKIYQDGVCMGVYCGDTVAAAYHPKKDVASWEACLNLALAPPR